MAVTRQFNWTGQMRADLAHLRLIELAAAYDSDVFSGIALSGRQPLVVGGFNLVTTGAVGNDAEALVLQTAGGTAVNYNATESGSLFQTPDDRADEVLGPTNPRVQGSFTPGAINFVGLDFVRSADDSTVDSVAFLSTTTNQEAFETLPLGRTVDYAVVISTTEFSATPGVVPVAIVTTDASNKVSNIEDARPLLGRLGTGGANPQPLAPYPFPGGRIEADFTRGGDRSLTDLKSWMDAVMTRIWEGNGGEYWYSATADRNVRMATKGSTFTNGEYFEWISSTNLHWQGILFILDNSTGTVNEVADQTTDQSGLTDLADGECLYVDLDRAADHTVSGANPLQAKKGRLAVLGVSARPGSRWVLAWRVGSNVFTRDRYLPVSVTPPGGATTTNFGLLRTTIDPDGSFTQTQPVAAGIAMHAGNFTATAGGLSHNLDLGAGWALAGGDLLIGRGVAAGDQNIIIATDDPGYETEVQGHNIYTTGSRSALKVRQRNTTGSAHDRRILDLVGYDGAAERSAMNVSASGMVFLRNLVGNTMVTPVMTSSDPARAGFGFKTNGLSSPNTRDQFAIIWWDGTETVLAEGPPY